MNLVAKSGGVIGVDIDDPCLLESVGKSLGKSPADGNRATIMLNHKFSKSERQVKRQRLFYLGNSISRDKRGGAGYVLCHRAPPPAQGPISACVPGPLVAGKHERRTDLTPSLRMPSTGERGVSVDIRGTDPHQSDNGSMAAHIEDEGPEAPSWAAPAISMLSFEGELLTNENPRSIGNSYANLIRAATARPGSSDITVDLSTAYFTLGGWAKIASALRSTSRIRLLLGTEPTVSDHVAGNVRREPTRAEVKAQVVAGRDAIPIQRETLERARRLCQLIEDGRLEVHLYTRGFLHGKTLHISVNGKPSVASVGSANLTAAGLTSNMEAALASKQERMAVAAQAWFERMWNASEDFSEEFADLYRQRCESLDPGTAFLRMLWEQYGQDLDEARQEPVASDLWLEGLADFQRDGALRADRIAARFGGVLISDEVGLGKTYVAGALVKAAVIAGGKCLVVAPKSIKVDVWEKYISENEDLLGGRVLALTYGEIRNKANYRSLDLQDVSLVLVDEAHNLRNRSRKQYGALKDILKHTRNARRVLVTATPINNEVRDLYNLLSLFLRDDALLGDGIPSMRELLDEADRIDPELFPWNQLWHLIDRVTVRRTREFVRYMYAQDGVLRGPDGSEWNFPALQPPIQCRYEVGDSERSLVEEVVSALGAGTGEGLRLAVYQPLNYVATSGSMSETLQQNIAALVRSTLLKRLESSPKAFEVTCRNIADAIARLDSALNASATEDEAKGMDEVLGSELMNLDDFTEGDVGDEEAADDPATAEGGDAVNRAWLEVDLAALPSGVRTRLAEDLAHDRVMLESWAERSAESLLVPHQHPKVIELAKCLAQVSSNAKDDQDRRKVLVFSSQVETVTWLEETLQNHWGSLLAMFPALSVYGKKVPCVGVATGRMTQANRRQTLRRFAPRTMAGSDLDETQSDIDILLSTDVLAEGVNLQQCGHIVNFDLPWNPMRLIQRIGRVDRLQSSHTTVQNYVFFPGETLDEYLGLEETLRKKIGKARGALGENDPVFHGNGVRGQSTFTGDLSGDTPDSVDLHLAPVMPLFDGNPDQAEVEMLRRRLADAFDEQLLQEAVIEFPPGGGAEFEAPPGRPDSYVFCARVSHPTLPEAETVFHTFAFKESLGKHVSLYDPTFAFRFGDPCHPKTSLPAQPLEALDLEKLEGWWSVAKDLIIQRWNATAKEEATARWAVPPGQALPAPEEIRALATGIRPRQIEHLAAVVTRPLLGLHREQLRELFDKKQFDEAHRYVVRQGLITAATGTRPIISDVDVSLIAWLHARATN